MMDTVGTDKEYKKKQKALQKRVKSLGVDNPVVKKAVKRLEPSRDAYEDFEIVHELVSAAYSEYEGQGNLKTCMSDLGKAISKAAAKVGNKKDDLADDF